MSCFSNTVKDVCCNDVWKDPLPRSPSIAEREWCCIASVTVIIMWQRQDQKRNLAYTTLCGSRHSLQFWNNSSSHPPTKRATRHKNRRVNIMVVITMMGIQHSKQSDHLGKVWRRRTFHQFYCSFESCRLEACKLLESTPSISDNLLCNLSSLAKVLNKTLMFNACSQKRYLYWTLIVYSILMQSRHSNIRIGGWDLFFTRFPPSLCCDMSIFFFVSIYLFMTTCSHGSHSFSYVHQHLQ